MTTPFDFPRMYGKLGNWPGSIGPQAAMVLLQEIAKLPKGSSIIEFRFDGGKTSAVIGWGCKAGGHVGIVTGSPSPDGMSEVWFNRLVMLFDLGGILHREYAPNPYAADMLVVNPGYHVTDEWRAALKVGGKIFHVAEVRCETKEAIPELVQERGAVEDSENSEKPTAKGRLIPSPTLGLLGQPDEKEAIIRLVDQSDGPLPQGVGGDGAGADSQTLKADAGPVARDDGDGRGGRRPRKGREKVVPEKGGV